MKKLISILSAAMVFFLVSCTPSPTDNNEKNQQKENAAGDSPAAQTVDLEISADLGTGWDSGVNIEAAKFAQMVSGDYLTITTAASASEAAYYQLQLKSGETYFSSTDEMTNVASYTEEYNVINLMAAAQSLVFSPSDSEISLLKSNGLYVNGYGVKITSVTIRINAKLDSADEEKDASDDDDEEISADLSDSNATSNAKKVMNYLNSIYGQKMLTGVMDCAWSSDVDMEAKVYNDTGKYPALVGYDFIMLTKSDSKSWYSPTQVEEAKTAWNNGSLVTFCWHWTDPTATSGNGASYSPSEMGFRIPYDEDTDALDESSDAFTYIKNDLDTVAAYLSELQQAGVVVIWRPLHEAKGNCGLYNNTGTAWFWWGAGNSCEANDDGTYTVSTDEDICSASYLALWRYMYTYFTQTKGLHNLIWLWNGQGAKWYPGDDYCDIVGYDIYDDDNANGAGQSYYDNLMTWCGSSKMTTISECGYIPSTASVQAGTAKWLYYMVWNDDDNDNFWGGTAYNSSQAKTTDSFDTDFTVKRGDSDLVSLFSSMGVTIN